MDHFDKNIQKKLSKGPDRTPDPEVWRQVRKGLENGSSGLGGKQWWQWLITAALILFLCSIAFILGQKNNANDDRFRQQLEEMSKVIAELNETIRDTIYLRDTIWQLPPPAYLLSTSGIVGSGSNKSPIVHRSYKTQARQPLIYGNYYHSLASSLLKAPDLNPWNNHLSYPIEYKLSNPYKSIGESSSIKATALGRPQARVEDILTKSTVPIFHFRRVISLHPYRALYAKEIIQLGRRRKIWESIWPDQHRIALVGGVFNLATEDLEHPIEWSFLLQYEMFFSSRFSLLTGLRYRSFSAKIEHDLEDRPYPLPADLITGDRLHEVYISNRYISIPIVTRYSISQGKHFRPYVHAGLLFTKTISQNYKFEIIRQGSVLKLNSKIGNGPMILSSYLMGAGVEYQLSHRVSTSLDLEGRYQFKLSNNQVQKYNGLGFRLGMHYAL